MACWWRSLLFRVAQQWIAGETYEDAIERAQQSATHDINGIINLLGEDEKVFEDIELHTSEYLKILNEIVTRKMQSCISVKPTQLGLAVDRPFYVKNIERLLRKADSIGNFVWIDMEGHEYTDSTVETYLEFLKNHSNVGVAVQAYMKNSEAHIQRILDASGIIRLCKGAYNESSEIIFRDRKEIRENFSKLMKIMFQRGRRFAIATHDEKLIEEAVELSWHHHTDFEFQMLMGIRDDKKLALVREGHRVSEYIPYGKNWWAYSSRRIREHKGNILLLARSLVSQA